MVSFRARQQARDDLLHTGIDLGTLPTNSTSTPEHTLGPSLPQADADTAGTEHVVTSQPNPSPDGLTRSSSFGKGKSSWKIFCARLQSPLLGKTRWWNISDFSVQLDDPHRLYVRDDLVPGSVSIHVTRPFRVTHAVVRLQGYAHVFRRPHAPGKKHADRNASDNHSSVSGAPSEPVYLGNGFISLFESEQVVCGEGRLSDGEYKLRFKLRFPDTPLPTGIDFERGSIGYYVSAILTRPTTIAPTLKCQQKIAFVESVDIAALGSPKPRILSLEPVRATSKSRQGSVMRPREATAIDGEAAQVSERQEIASQSPVESVSGLSSAGRLKLQTSYSRSMQPYSDQYNVEESVIPDPSIDQSISDNLSMSNTNNYYDESVHPEGSPDGLPPVVGITQPSSRTRRRGRKKNKKAIVTTIELGRSGYLRGDSIPLYIHVAHTKAVSSTNGVIVTLYRQARVDSIPALPGSSSVPDLPAVGGAVRPNRKSRLTSYSHVFRKDLAQSFASLVINPSTLTTDIRTAVRVPEDAFPTIDCVPGRIISFRYFVEVVLDVNSKLGGLGRVNHTTTTTTHASFRGAVMSTPALNPELLSSLTGVNQTGVYAPVVSASLGPAPALPFMFSGPHFVDTEPVRRNKDIVACTFEVVIGSIDSDRVYPPLRSRADLTSTDESTTTTSAARVVNNSVNTTDSTLAAAYTAGGQSQIQSLDDVISPMIDPGRLGSTLLPTVTVNSSTPPRDNLAVPVLLSEKEQLRLAQDLLLPSAPPVGPSRISFPDDSRDDIGVGSSTDHSNWHQSSVPNHLASVPEYSSLYDSHTSVGPIRSVGQTQSNEEFASTSARPVESSSLSSRDNEALPPPVYVLSSLDHRTGQEPANHPSVGDRARAVLNPLHLNHEHREPTAPMLDDDDDLLQLVGNDWAEPNVEGLHLHSRPQISNTCSQPDNGESSSSRTTRALHRSSRTENELPQYDERGRPS